MAWKLQSNKDNRLTYINDRTGEVSRWNLIYSHPEFGNFYIIDNLLNLSFTRRFIFDNIQALEKIGIDKKELQSRCDTMLQLLKDKPSGYDLDLYNNLTTINNTLKNHWDIYKTYLAIIPLCIIQDGEDVSGYDQQEAQNKINTWAKDRAMIDFFLNYLQKIIK